MVSDVILCQQAATGRRQHKASVVEDPGSGSDMEREQSASEASGAQEDASSSGGELSVHCKRDHLAALQAGRPGVSQQVLSMLAVTDDVILTSLPVNRQTAGHAWHD